MANGITGGLESLLGLDTTAGTAQLQQALSALQAVNVPNISQLTLPELQKYVQAGVLTPAQYEAISANPQAYQQIASAADQTGTNAQKAALQQLSGVVQAGGSTPINQANLLNNINTTNQAMQAARQGIQENAQERGVSGGGLNFINQLMNEQSNANTANQGAVNAAANNAQLALQAMTQGGQLGGQLQGQANTMATNEAQAAQQIAEYNSQLQSAANQYNTQNANAAQAANLTNAQNISNTNAGLANQRTLYNAQLPTQEYNMQMQKAQDVAGNYGQQANLAEQQAASQNQFTGSLIGAGATLGGDYLMGNAIGNKVAGGNAPASNMQDYTTLNQQGMASTPPPGSNYGGYAEGGEIVDSADKEFHSAMRQEGHKMGIKPQGYCGGGMCYAKGGEVHDHEICMKLGGPVPGTPKVPGDSTKNDTIPAKLSPHEIVLPRTVAQAPNAPQAAAQFVQGVKQNGGQPPMMQPKPLDFASIIKQLEDNGLELRLSTKGA